MSDQHSPKQALESYFEELLAGEEALTTRYAEPDINKQQRLEKLLQSAQPQLAVVPVVAAPVEPLVQESSLEVQEWNIESPATTQVDVQSVSETSPEKSSEVESHYTVEGLEWAANGLPQWAQKEFDVLLFQVSGLTLAVPLIALGQIQPLTDELTPLFGQADWFMGLLPTPTGKIRTVNTAKFVMPERYDDVFLKTAKYVISIDGVPWGLAVDSVNQPITLKPTDVKWRTERTKRPWLAGTVKDHMCALLDIPMIGQLLMDADRNSPHQRTQKLPH